MVRLFLLLLVPAENRDGATLFLESVDQLLKVNLGMAEIEQPGDDDISSNFFACIGKAGVNRESDMEDLVEQTELNLRMPMSMRKSSYSCIYLKLSKHS